MQKVVGLVGLRGSGKDTAAKVLVEHGWRRIAFADALYQEVSKAFGVSVDFLGDRDKKESPQDELALHHCLEHTFITMMLAHEGLRVGHSSAQELFACLGKPRSPREILQKWGTEYRRMSFRDDYWRAQVHEAIQAEPKVNFVVTDVRFPDEARLIEVQLQGQLGRVVRPSLPGADDPALLHASEVAMRDYPIEQVFINEEGLEKLPQFQAKVLAALH